MLFDKICRENGITHRLTAPRSPTTTGKIERFHRTLRTEFLRGRTFSTLEVAQKEIDAFVVEYNTERPHRAMKMATPSERFYRRVDGSIPTLDPDLRSIGEDRTGDDWVSRVVSVNGVITVSNQAFSVGRHRSGEVVDVHVTKGTLEVWCGNELLKTVARASSGEVRKKRAEHQPKRR